MLPLVEFSVLVTVLLDIVLWFIIHMGMSKLALIIPDSVYDKKLPNRVHKHKIQMFIYKRIFFVHKYKKYLPDGGAWFKDGFSKKHLKEKNITYYQQFLIETRRAEWSHYFQLLPVPLFFLFNPLYVSYGMIVYALLVNLPCILAQKYNQIRFTNLLVKLQSKAK